MRRTILFLWFFLCDLYIPADSTGDLASSDLWNYYIKQAFCMASWKAKDLNFCDGIHLDHMEEGTDRLDNLDYETDEEEGAEVNETTLNVIYAWGKDYITGFPIVKHEDEILSCLKRTAQAEKVEDRTEVEAVYQTFVDMCMAGTETNKLYMANRGCVKNVMADRSAFSACSATMVVKATEFSAEQLKEPNFLRRLTCENAEDLNGCVAEFVKQRCGDGGTKFLHAYTDSSNRLLKQACLESGNGSGITAGNMYFSVIQVLTALAMIKWFSL